MTATEALEFIKQARALGASKISYSGDTFIVEFGSPIPTSRKTEHPPQPNTPLMSETEQVLISRMKELVTNSKQ